jgi:ribosomal protein L39E
MSAEGWTMAHSHTQVFRLTIQLTDLGTGSQFIKSKIWCIHRIPNFQKKEKETKCQCYRILKINQAIPVWVRAIQTRELSGQEEQSRLLCYRDLLTELLLNYRER